MQSAEPAQLSDTPGTEVAEPKLARPEFAQAAQAVQSDSNEVDWEQLKPSTFYGRWGQRLFDVALMLLTLVPALVLGCMVAAGNWLIFRDLKQIFFVQERVGFRGETFRMIKFRTMRETKNEFGSWGSGADRLRVTSFGRFLRNTHLDELGQIINVWRGEMSFIGPRPEMVEIESWASEHIQGFSQRMAVRPGITGYAQITQGYTGNDIEAYRRKFLMSEDYRLKQSLSLDLHILWRTAAWMLRGRGWKWDGVSSSASSIAKPEPELAAQGACAEPTQAIKDKLA